MTWRLARSHKGEHNPQGVDHPRAVLDENSVRLIRIDAARGATKAALGRQYGVARTTIVSVVRRKTWRHVA